MNNEKMRQYKGFAVAFSYPGGAMPEKGQLRLEYDRLFRSNEVWLYCCEYLAENEFQRAKALADINGFYRAFGLETDRERPDALGCELEFMHYLIFKEANASDREKASICLDAQKKFFNEHLLSPAKR